MKLLGEKKNCDFLFASRHFYTFSLFQARLFEKIEIETFQNRTKSGNTKYLVQWVIV